MTRSQRPVWWYGLALRLTQPLYRWRVRQRSGHESDYADEVAQRFGPQPVLGLAFGDRPPVWVHAVSVGETHAARPIIQALLEAGWPVVVTSTTRTGRARVQALFREELGRRVESRFLPIDTPEQVGAFLDHVKPVAIGLIETELWPNLIAEAQTRQVPIALLNARLSERSAHGYARFGALTRPMMGQLTRICAQDQATAERLIALGAQPQQVAVTGSLKFDLEPPDSALTLADQLRPALTSRTVWVAASTHEPEEAQLIEAFKQLQARYPELLLILVPRHPERFEAVAERMTQVGLTLERRSQGHWPNARTEVYLADSMGELWTWYALADMAFIGGSLAPVGGHNPLEAVRLGVPVVVGPCTHNFSQIVSQLESAGALAVVNDQATLTEQLHHWLTRPDLRMQAGRAGAQVLEQSRGALERQLARFMALLPSIAAP